MAPSAGEDEEPIYSLATECEELFEKGAYLGLLAEAGAVQLWEEHRERFTTWAAYLGVFAKRSLCLDRRLEHHPTLHDLVLRLLDILQRNLIRVITGRDDLTRQSALILEEDTSAKSGGGPLIDALKAIESTIERLNRLGVAIRESSVSSRARRARKLAERPDYASFKDLAHLAVQALYPYTSVSLQDQLSTSMADRYADILSRRTRQQKLETPRAKSQPVLRAIDEDSVIEDPDATPDSFVHTAPIEAPRSINNVTPTPESKSLFSSEQPSSVNTRLVESRMKGLWQSDSRRGSASTVQINRVTYPTPLHARDGQNFLTCPWCLENHPKQFFEGSSWRHHVDRDLKPYVCLADNCTDPLPSFTNFQDWHSHMLSKHGWNWHREVHRPLSWACPICPGMSAEFKDTDETYTHIRNSHKLGLHDADLQVIVGQSRLQVRRRHGQCPICCLRIESESSPRASADDRKRRQESLGLGSPKRTKTNSRLSKLSQPIQNVSSGDDLDAEARDILEKEESPLPIEDIARHIASHLQGLSFLTTRLISIHNLDDSDTVFQGSSADTDAYSSSSCLRPGDDDSRQTGTIILRWDDDPGVMDIDVDYEPPVSVDEAESPVVWDHIPLDKNGTQAIDDVLEHWKFMADKCLVQYNPSTLESGDIQRPLKRRPVKIRCPGDKCSTETRSWICRKCTSSVEFGYTDKFIYCDCGRSGYENYKFKCCSSGHGPAYVSYPNDRLLLRLQTLGPGDYLNILILGEAGVGKSTFINAFVNYLEYESLDEAKNSDLNVLIPCTFSTQVMDHERGKIVNSRVTVGDELNRSDERDGSRGSSATQKTRVYSVAIGDRTIRLIDTPGIGDTRGLEYDKRNMTDILSTLSSYDYLHGILILVKSNNARLTVTFDFCMKQLLTNLHRSAADNIVFGFTNSRISNYSLGDTFGPLNAILGGQKDVNIELTTRNVYSFDSESFRYLAAKKKNVHMSNEEDFRRSWENSSEEVRRLIRHFEEKTPHPVIGTISITGTRRLINELTKPMVEISAIIRTNIAMLTDRMHDIQNDKVSIENLRQRLNIETDLLRTRDLARPRTVCSHQACRTFKQDSSGTGTLQAVYSQVCHENCKRPNVALENIADPGLIKCQAFNGSTSCKVCSHRWEQHLHIMYELESYKTTVKDEGIEAQIRQPVSDLVLKQETIDQLTKRISEYKDEHDKISRAAAQFCFFLQQNSMAAINDKTLEYIDYLINEEKSKEQQGGGRQKLDGLYQDREKHVQLVEVMERDMKLGVQGGGVAALDREGVDNAVKGLYGLKHFGGSLRALKKGIAAAHQATYREIPFRVGRRRRPTTASPRHPARPQIQARRPSLITSVLAGGSRRLRSSHTNS